jgi:hypothetical protein
MITLLALVTGCSTPTPVAPTVPTLAVEPATPDLPTPPLPEVDTEGLGEVTPPDAAVPARLRRRMRIAQLDASIEAATGFAWEVNGTNQFEALSSSLGVPDYVERVGEDLDAGLLFQKFLDDAANTVCQDMVEAEFAGTSSIFLTDVEPTDTFLANPAGVDATLTNAVRRFHGYSIAPGDPQLDSWRFLFESTLSVTDDDTLAAWRAVCIGLIVHPDFYQY